jgi:hypothetical protein
MPALLTPIGLVSVTNAQRDALTPSDGQLIWNADLRQVERFVFGRWKRLDDEAMQLIGALSVSLGQVRSALRYMGVEPDLFDQQ